MLRTWQCKQSICSILDGTSVNGKDAMTIQNILKKHSINYNGLNYKKENRLKFLIGNVKFYKDAWNL